MIDPSRRPATIGPHLFTEGQARPPHPLPVGCRQPRAIQARQERWLDPAPSSSKGRHPHDKDHGVLLQRSRVSKLASTRENRHLVFAPPVPAPSPPWPQAWPEPLRPNGPAAVMGVLNLTPDSFSDGGRLPTVEAAVRQAARMLRQGAAVLDLGAQSTRPGAEEVGASAELARLLPSLRAIRAAWPDLVLSVDTFHAAVAEAALEAGATWINDVYGANLTPEAPNGTLRDPAMLSVIATAGCPYVVMHSRGDSRTMDGLTTDGDVVAEVRDALRAATEQALAAGLRPEQILWDPGLGFAKTTTHNLELVRRLPELTSEGVPLLVGPSRKRFIGAVLDEPRPRARLWGTAAICALAVARGAAVLRVHDVGPIVQVARMAEAVGAEVRDEQESKRELNNSI
jgi:dihydropteroate synthase